MNTPGELITIEGRPALRFERRYRQPVQRVWRAITEPDEVRRWFPSDIEGERAVGAELRFVDDAQRAAAREAGEPTRVDGPMFRGTVIAYDPPTVFSFSWGGEVLRLELVPDGDGTLLVFTHLLSHQSVAARTGSGWHACLAELTRMLDPEQAGGEDDADVYDRYVDRVGPELGVPSGGGAITWERHTHVGPEAVRAATAGADEMAAWGAGDRSGEPLRWDLEPTDDGTTFRLTHGAIGDDAELAATWHALLVQLDLYLAAGTYLPVTPERWVDPYRVVLDRARGGAAV